MVDTVYHGGCLVEEHDLVAGLDLTGVQHELLCVDHAQALPLHLEQERGFDDVYADGRVRDSGLLQQALDLPDC